MKSDVVFGLDDAAWPVLLVDSAGTIRSANRAALHVFGAELESGTKALAEIWLAENESNPAQLFAAAETNAALLPLKLFAGGITHSFLAAISLVTCAGVKHCLLQLLPKGPGEARNPAMDAGLAHKQKLDCALQMARTVALDFNNALTSVLGHTSLVLSKMEADHPWRAWLVEVEKSASRAAEIAHDLATFSRQEKEVKVQSAGNINILLQREVESFRSRPLDKQVTWSLQLERRLYSARFDEAKMQQAFSKVIENAVEALGPQGRVTLQTKNLELTQPTQDRNAQLAAGAYVCVEITDNGSGIETEVMPRIFEPFFTTKRGGKHRGLGLAWVYGVVTNHGGGVAISSQSGAGTSVRIYLPANKKLVKDDRMHHDDLTGDQTILMVDDEDLLLTMGQTILSAYGYRVLTANSGHKALEILSKPDQQVDLVITDLVMPGMSGRELVEQLRLVSPDTRVLCSSGYVRGGQDSEEGIGYLQKPFSSQELLLKVKQSLMAGEAASVD